MNTTISKSIKYIAIALVATLHYSCIKEVEDFNLPNTPPKLVVQSFISPGDSITATVYASTPVNYNIPMPENFYYGYAFDTIKTATITITNIKNGNSVAIPYNAEQKKYALPPSAFTISKGNEYELTASASNFETVKGKTVVPFGTGTYSLEKIDTTYSDEWGYIDMLLIGSINDPVNEENYYNSSIYTIRESMYNDTTQTYFSSYTSALLNDHNFDGLSIPIRQYFFGEEDDEYSRTRSIKSKVYEVDKHYYKFHKSLETIYYVMDNPFSESSHLYSNIEGGLGVFASFAQIGEKSIEY